MIENYSDKQPLTKERSQKDIKKAKNHLGCLILILIVLFLFVAYFPGFLAYREQGHLQQAERIARNIQKALAAYKENQTNQRYPVNISNWHTFRKLVPTTVLDIPNTPSDAQIKTYHYESIDGSDYQLIFEVDLPDNTSWERFLLVTPNEVTRHKNRP